MVNGTVSAGVYLPRTLFGVRFRDYYCSTKSWTLRNFQTPLQATRHRSTGPFLCKRRCGFSLSRFWATPEEKGLAVVAISSNSVQTHPEDGPAFMAEYAKEYGYPLPYLYDEEVSTMPLACIGFASFCDRLQTQEVAKAYGAVCTPDFSLFKKDGRRPFELAYHGCFDDSYPRSNIAIAGRYALLADQCRSLYRY